MELAGNCSIGDRRKLGSLKTGGTTAIERTRSLANVRCRVREVASVRLRRTQQNNDVGEGCVHPFIQYQRDDRSDRRLARRLPVLSSVNEGDVY